MNILWLIFWLAVVPGALGLGVGGISLVDTMTRLTPVEVIKHFETQEPPLTTLNYATLAAVFGNETELLSPRTLLPSSQDLASLKWLKSQRCPLSANKKTNSSPQLSKAVEWQNAACEGRRLAATFFDHPPFMHPVGKSYAQLAGLAEEQYRSRMHVKEVTSIPGFAAETFLILQKLSMDALEGLVNNRPMIVDTNFILLRSRDKQSDTQEQVYRIYSAPVWRDYLSEHNLVVSFPRDLTTCHQTIDSSCWRYVPLRHQGLRYGLFYSGLILLSVGGTLLAGIVMFRQFKTTRIFTKEREFLIHALAHELRTPVANLKLIAANMAHRNDPSFLIDLDIQIARLTRLTDASRLFMSGKDGAGLHETVGNVPVADIKALIESLVQARPVKLLLQLEAGSDLVLIRTNLSLLGLCFENVLDNALRHGAAPVVAKIVLTGKSLTLSVEDQGSWNPDTAKKGLGIGLLLVKRGVASMGGKLVVAQSPTVVTIQLSRGDFRA